MEYEAVIGLEVHLHLKTKTKAFCGCSTEFGKEPNSQVCPVCLGFPGSLPVFNKTALEYAIRVALAVNCKVQEYTKFDRKNYFYPDLPKNYQISQYDLPLSKEGFLDIETEGKVKRIGITRVHMEEDAGKLIHKEEISLVDFNRTGIPLLEIVSEPDINSPQEAHAYLTALKSTIEYLDVSDCDMEKGSLRCDANISLRPKGTSGLGVKTELKNMNSFKAVKDALAYEIERQEELLKSGKEMAQETRLWDAREGKTLLMRTKEEAQDYRYFPDPDLTAFLIQSRDVEEIRKALPELPKEKMLRFMRDYAISEYDAKILVSDKETADYAEKCVNVYAKKDKRPLVNWLIGQLAAIASDHGCSISELKVRPEELVSLIGYVESDQISNLSAKSVLEDMVNTGNNCAQIIRDKNLIQISDVSLLDGFIEEAIKNNPQSVEAYKSGKENAVMFLVGQVMKKSAGKANPKVVQEMLKRRLNNA